MCIDFPSELQGRERKTRRSCLVNLSTLRPSQSIHRFLCGGENKDHTCRESVYWLDPRTGGTKWRCWKRISPVFQSITFMLDSSWFSSLRFQRLDCIHGHGWMPWTVTEHSFGVNVNESILLLSQSHGGQRSLSPLLSALPVLILLSCTLLLRLLSCLCPSLTFSSTLSWHRSSPEPPPSICHPANSLSPSFLDSPLSIVCILPLSLPLFPSFVPFLLFILFACFSAWTSAPHSSFCIFLLHPLPPPASSLLTGHLIPPLYPAVSLPCSPLSLPTLPRHSYLFLWLAIFPSSILVIVWREWAPRPQKTSNSCASLIFLASKDKGKDTLGIVWKIEGMGETLIAGGLFLIISREKGASLVVHGRECLAMQGTWVQTLVWKIQQVEELLSPGTSATELTPCNYWSLCA